MYVRSVTKQTIVVGRHWILVL